MNIRKICFIAGQYPTIDNPKASVFYKNLIEQFALMDIECRVIHPYIMNKKGKYHKFMRRDEINEEKYVEVYRPKTLTLGAKKILNFNTAYLSACLYTYSVKRCLKKMNWYPDVFYGHFISSPGIIAAKLSAKTGIPAFIAYGESSSWSINSIGVSRCKKILKDIKGFISVSSKNSNELIDLAICKKNRVKVFPNAINDKKFYKRDKIEARKMLGWEEDKFIVAFTGHFNHRKGVLRINEATKSLKDIYIAYAGSGDLEPEQDNIIYKGNVEPDLMPWFLSAADVFILPTLNEGCCNAIIEAMACGLPIISSNLDFNLDILSEKDAILIDPQNITEIRESILKLKNDKNLRDYLSRRSLEKAKKLTLDRRVKNILIWMEKQCK